MRPLVRTTLYIHQSDAFPTPLGKRCGNLRHISQFLHEQFDLLPNSPQIFLSCIPLRKRFLECRGCSIVVIFRTRDNVPLWSGNVNYVRGAQ